MDYKECVEFLINIPKFTKTKSKDNCFKILKEMGNPQNDFKVFHVAGTNGKGSVCSFINNIMTKSGFEVGMFTSPHLVKINERIKINGVDISDEEFHKAFTIVSETVSELFRDTYVPTFFEYMFLIAVVAFKRRNVRYAIFEVGMGGRLDATNMIENPAVSIITSISKDHMEILGESISQIAYEKAGIIKENVPVIYYGENNDVCQVIEEVVKNKKTKSFSVKKEDIVITEKSDKSIDFYLVNMYDKYGLLSSPFGMDYQTINASLALLAIDKVLENDETLRDALDFTKIKEGLKVTKWPGRMEEIKPGVYVDGAHNYEGIEAFTKYVNDISRGRKSYIFFSVVKEKEYVEMMDMILGINDVAGYIVAPMANARALAVSDMAEHLKKHSDVPVYVFEDIKAGYEGALKMKKEDDLLFCTGSLYMVGELKSMEDKNDQF